MRNKQTKKIYHCLQLQSVAVKIIEHTRHAAVQLSVTQLYIANEYKIQLETTWHTGHISSSLITSAVT